MSWEINDKPGRINKGSIDCSLGGDTMNKIWEGVHNLHNPTNYTGVGIEQRINTE